jgi:lysine 2,3-aminomutase
MNDQSVLSRRRTLRSPADLADAGLAPQGDVAMLDGVAQRYAVAVTPEVAALIDPADPADPIARQFIPNLAELSMRPEERADPIGDDAHSPVQGIVHRYPDRVLLKAVSICPVYCRFCFRREVVGPGGTGSLSPEALDQALAYIAAHPAIWEVIVTGGDPLVLAPRRIAEITQALAATGHVKVVRWHTRVPVVDSGRVTQALADALSSDAVTTYVAIHANHPREFTPAARAAIGLLADAGLSLVSQSVLLKGVNDDADTLAALMRCFVEARVKPYLLHHADLAPGTAGFRTTIAEGQALIAALRGRLSGLCQPTYVIDIPGGHGKSPIGPGYLEHDGEGWRIRDFNGAWHAYPPVGSV